MLIAVLALTPFYLEVRHLPILPALILSLCGALAAVLITLPTAYGLDEWFGEQRSLLDWLVPGMGFGALLPFLSGAFLPAGFVFVALQQGIIGAGDLGIQLLDAGFLAPGKAFFFGFLTLFVGLFTGAFLSIGGWTIERANRSSRIQVSSYGPWAIAVSLGIVAVTIAASTPTQIIAKIHQVGGFPVGAFNF